MKRSEKQQWVSDVHAILDSTQIVIITQYKGLNVAQMSDLRGRVREAGAGFKVTKNRLTKRALEGTQYSGLAQHFTGPTAIAYADEPVAAAKVIAEFAKKNEHLVMVGGAFGEHQLDVDGIKQLASLPSLDELRAKLIALITTPAQRVASVTQAPAGQLARVFGAYAASEAA